MIPQTTFYLFSHALSTPTLRNHAPLRPRLRARLYRSHHAAYALFSELKQRIDEAVFDSSTNALAEKILTN